MRATRSSALLLDDLAYSPHDLSTERGDVFDTERDNRLDYSEPPLCRHQPDRGPVAIPPSPAPVPAPPVPSGDLLALREHQWRVFPPDAGGNRPRSPAEMFPPPGDGLIVPYSLLVSSAGRVLPH